MISANGLIIQSQHMISAHGLMNSAHDVSTRNYHMISAHDPSTRTHHMNSAHQGSTTHGLKYMMSAYCLSSHTTLMILAAHHLYCI